MRRPGPRSLSSIDPSRPRGAAGGRAAAAAFLTAMGVGVPALGDDEAPGTAPTLDAPQLDAPAVPPAATSKPPVIVSTPAPAPAWKPAANPGTTAGRASAGAVLAIPGLSGPGRPAGSPLPAALPGPAAEVDDGPALDAPIGMEAAPAGPARPPAGPDARATRSAGRPVLTLKDDGPAASPGAARPTGPTTRRSPADPANSRRVEPIPRSASPTPAPRRRFFGLLPAPPAVARTASAGAGHDHDHERDQGSPRDAARSAEKPAPAEAAARAALRARIEKQARLHVGERAQNIEVEVEGRNATVRAVGVKFYQKRAVRRSLETLPALAGLRSTIEVLD